MKYIYRIVPLLLVAVFSSCQWLPEVSGVRLSESNVTLKVGESRTLTATVEPAAAEYETIFWTSSDPSVVSVSNGQLSASKLGTATITASTEGVTSSPCTVTVEATRVTAVTLSNYSLELTEGESSPLIATVSPSNATDQSVTWYSSNSNVAWVSGSSVTAVAPGKATITVRTNDGGYTATCEVTVKSKTIAVTGVSLNRSSLTMDKGATSQLTATVSPSNATNKDVTWTSNNPDVATVASDGTVTANRIGTAKITVTTADGSKTASCSVTVKAVSVTGVTLSPSSLSMTVGETTWLTATVSPSNASNKDVTWTSSNTSVATVSSDGEVTAKKAGTATITAKTADGGKTATCSVTVKASTVSVTGVSLNTSSLTLQVGKTASLVATVSPSNATNKGVIWTVGNTSVASVTSSGLVTAKKVGTTVVTVKTSDGGKTATCTVTVKSSTVSVTGVAISPTSLSLTAGDTYELTPTVSPSNATNKAVTWSSSNTSVATVSSDGTVTAKSAGSATITCTTSDGGKTATCSVTVKAGTVSVTGVSLNRTSMSLTAGTTGTLTATVSPSNATNKEVTWSSNNTSVATVSSSGVVTAKAAGSATITCTTSDGSKKATCTVSVTAATISVTGVSLNRSTMSLVAGSTGNLTATVSPSNATNTGVSWSSSNTSVATVSSSGVVTAKAAGTASITVTTFDGSKTASCTVTVTNASVAVTGVSISPTSLSLKPGQTSKLTPTVSPSNATNISVSWTSSNTSVATVASDGTVTAKAAGSSTITCTTQDGNKTAKATVSVSAPSLVSLVPRRNGSSSGENIFRDNGGSDYLSTTESDVNSILYGSVGMNSSSFHSLYDRMRVLSDPIGTVSEYLFNSGTHQLRWTLSEEELWEYAGEEVSVTVRYYSSSSSSIYIDVKLTAIVAEVMHVVALRSSSGDYVSSRWTSEYYATTYTATVPSSSETNPNKCQIIADINASFTTWSSGSDAGKLKVDNIDEVSYYFCSPHMEEITQIGDLNVRFRVSDDGETLYAALLNYDGTVSVAEQTVASIDNYKTSRLGISAWNMFNYVKGGTVADALLNTGSMYLYIGATAVLKSGRMLDVTFNGDDHFRANIIRPVYVTVKSSDGFKDGSAFGSEGSYIRLENLLAPKDWRDNLFSGHQNYWNYYGPWDIEVDLANAEWEYGGVRQSLPGNIRLIQVGQGATSARNPQTGATVSVPSNSYGYLMYCNTGENIIADFNIYIRVSGSYGFGDFDSDWVVIPVVKSTTPATVSVTGVSLDQTSLSLEEGKTATLAAMVSPSNATNKAVTWSSSNTSVATVSTSGVVTAKSAGSATITCTTEDGAKKATCAVTVSPATISVTGVSVSPKSLSLSVGQTSRLSANVSPSNATNTNVSWSSNNTSVATVASDGTVTAKAAGYASITCTTQDGSKKASCEVTVKTLNLTISNSSSGLLFRPYVYKRRSEKNLDSKDEKWIVQGEYFKCSFTVDYSVSPNYFTFDNSYVYDFILQDAQFSMTPRFQSCNNGVLSVVAVVEGQVASGLTWFALRASKNGESYTSGFLPANESGMIFSIKAKNRKSGSEWDISSLSSCWTSGGDLEQLRSSSDTVVNYTGALDLNTIITIKKANESTPNNAVDMTWEELEDAGLSLVFELVKNYRIGSPATDQANYATLSGSVFCPRGGDDAIGHAPIVRVKLMHDGDVVEVGYIKIFIAR